MTYLALWNGLFLMDRGFYTYTEMETDPWNTHPMFLFLLEFWIEFNFDKLRFMPM